jgi:hypothetical protein
VRKPSRSLVALCALALALAARPAHAYLDPASGSMMLQLLLGGLAGAAVALKLFWRKLRNMMTARRGAPAGPPGPERPGGV